MYGRPVIAQEWSVHAQLTISHGGPTQPTTIIRGGGGGGSSTESTIPSSIPSQQQPTATVSGLGDGGVHMEYTWKSHPASQERPTSLATDQPSFGRGASDFGYGFQRGNILFTSRPPQQHSTESHGDSFRYGPNSFDSSHSGFLRSSSGVSQSRGGTLGRGFSSLSGISHLDSGYNSEQPSPLSYSSLPTRRSAQPYNRRCKSTCNIVLSNSTPDGTHSFQYSPPHSFRDQSLHFPTSDSLHLNQATDNYGVRSGSGAVTGYPPRTSYPVHTGPVESVRSIRPLSSEFSPVPEGCEECSSLRSKSPNSSHRTFTSHFCTHVQEKAAQESIGTKHSISARDAAIQTTDLNSSTVVKPSQPKMGRRAYEGRHRTDPQLMPSSTLQVPQDKKLEGKDKKKHGKRLARSPARLRGTSPLQGKKPHSVKPEDSEKKQIKIGNKSRTVHIDVYCTGSDEDADDSDSDSSTEGKAVSSADDGRSSPQTVFESEQFRVIHERAKKHQLPMSFLQGEDTKDKRASSTISRRSESFKYSSFIDRESIPSRGYDSDDGASTQYPSRSSTTTFHELESNLWSDSASVVTRDWSIGSNLSSGASHPEESDSTATSWKDTTDIESLAHSAISAVQSSDSIAHSDSFEYADSIDRLRIQEKEKTWAEMSAEDQEQSKTWRSPQVERRQFLQQQKFKEFLAKHLGKIPMPSWKFGSNEESDDSADSENAWGGSRKEGESKRPLRRESTVRKANKAKVDKPSVEDGLSASKLKASTEKSRFFSKSESDSSFVQLAERTASTEVATSVAASSREPGMCDVGSLSDSGPPPLHRFTKRVTLGPFGPKSPSPPPRKFQSTVTSPFTSTVGMKTDQFSKAVKFGTIVGVFRKPGHHVGPSKNPECMCEHCRKYFEDSVFRTRTRSVGDIPIDNREEWRNTLDQLASSNENDSVSISKILLKDCGGQIGLGIIQPKSDDDKTNNSSGKTKKGGQLPESSTAKGSHVGTDQPS